MVGFMVDSIEVQSVEVVKQLRELGYLARYDVIDADSFGSPVPRKRLYFTGVLISGSLSAFVYTSTRVGCGPRMLLVIGSANAACNQVSNQSHVISHVL